MGMANLVTVVVPGKGKGLIANGLIVILWSFGGTYVSSEGERERERERERRIEEMTSKGR